MIANRAIGAAIVLALCCVTPARADIAYQGPLTFWRSGGSAPSDLAIAIAGIAISAAIIVAGFALIRSRFARPTVRRYAVLGGTALAVLAVVALGLEVRREAWHSRNRRWNPPPRPREEYTGAVPARLENSADPVNPVEGDAPSQE